MVNQLAIAGAGWDEEMLRIELPTLHQQNYDLDLIGFDDVELQRLREKFDAAPGLTDEDAAPEIQEEPVKIWRPFIRDSRLIGSIIIARLPMTSDVIEEGRVRTILEGFTSHFREFPKRAFHLREVRIQRR
jgi:hypothetical protein